MGRVEEAHVGLLSQGGSTGYGSRGCWSLFLPPRPNSPSPPAQFCILPTSPTMKNSTHCQRLLCDVCTVLRPNASTPPTLRAINMLYSKFITPSASSIQLPLALEPTGLGSRPLCTRNLQASVRLPAYFINKPLWVILSNTADANHELFCQTVNWVIRLSALPAFARTCGAPQARCASFHSHSSSATGGAMR